MTMKIIVSAGRTKRQIEGNYALCGSRDDLAVLRDVLNHALRDDANFCYGWVDVVADRPPPISGPPQSWE